MADTSPFTVEERLVAVAWYHERRNKHDDETGARRLRGAFWKASTVKMKSSSLGGKGISANYKCITVIYYYSWGL